MAADERLSSRVQRGVPLDAVCPLRDVFKHVTCRWGTLSLLVLLHGTQRFGELRRKIGGVSEKMLTQSLRALEHDGFIERRALPMLPPHVEYRLTPLGLTVAQRLEGLADWIESNMPQITAAQSTSASKRTPRAQAAMLRT